MVVLAYAVGKRECFPTPAASTPHFPSVLVCKSERVLPLAQTLLGIGAAAWLPHAFISIPVVTLELAKAAISFSMPRAEEDLGSSPIAGLLGAMKGVAVSRKAS